MTKLARVISIIFLTILSFAFPFQASAGFADLLNPTPSDPSLIANYQLPITNPPSVSFGDLLNSNQTQSAPENPTVLAEEEQYSIKTTQLKKLLAELEASYQADFSDFKEKSKNSITNYQLPITNDVSPSPFIPLPTLIASVSELAGTRYPTPTLSDTLLLASLNNSSRSSPASPQLPIVNYQLSNNNVLGALTQNPPKTYYTIALLGDSMTDTLGRDLPNLKNILKDNYPSYTFSLLNYGYGATDLESGLARLTNETNYLGTSYPPLLYFKPDILVVESFAYNHWSGEKFDLDRQWITIAKIIDTVREKSPDTKIILAATIAPNKYIFGDGILNWNKNAKENATLIIKAYLQNLVNYATSENYPLADAYHPTLDNKGNGLEQYINGGDHLHPSGEGAYLYSQKIVEAIRSNSLIN